MPPLYGHLFVSTTNITNNTESTTHCKCLTLDTNIQHLHDKANILTLHTLQASQNRHKSQHPTHSHTKHTHPENRNKLHATTTNILHTSKHTEKVTLAHIKQNMHTHYHRHYIPEHHED